MAAPVTLSNNYPSPSLVNSFPVRFFTLAGKTIAKEPGEQRGLLKSLGTIFKDIVFFPDLSAACFISDSILKILLNAENFDKLRTTSFSNDWRGTADKIKTYCNIYYFFETAAKVTFKLKVHTFAKIITPLAWTTFFMDFGIAVIDAAESAIEIGNRHRFSEWQHSFAKIDESKRKLRAGDPRGPSAEEIRSDHIRKHRIRFWSQTFDYAKDWCNVAFQISLMVMFCFLAAPLVGGSIGTGAAVSCCTVAFLGISKLMLKVTAITLDDGLKVGRRSRTGHFRDARGNRVAPGTAGATQRHPVLYTAKRHVAARPIIGAAAAVA